MGRSPEDLDEHHEAIVAPAGLANARNSEAAIVELRDGRLLLGYSEFVGPGDFSEAWVTGLVSDDKGRSWHGKHTLVSNTAGVNTMMPSLLRLASGELALFYLKMEDLGDSRMFVRKSATEGEAWGAEVCVTADMGTPPCCRHWGCTRLRMSVADRVPLPGE